jgi:hypothetical protein
MIAWDVPMEVLRALATAQGTAQLTHQALRHATFGAQARVVMHSGRFVGEYTFEEPAYPGRVQSSALQLVAVPQENAVVIPFREDVA